MGTGGLMDSSACVSPINSIQLIPYLACDSSLLARSLQDAKSALDWPAYITFAADF